ncbi:MBL fold metallo-hydrolase [Enterovirga sp.]|uniref:MBL fold metallo-hydrolase n=1 Tax=Enterovirga sp. TaxID=2026350 RepID=UPI003FA579B4
MVDRRALARIASAATVLTMGGVGYAALARSRNPYYRGPVTDHFDGVRFHRPGHDPEKGLLELARWQLSRARGRGSWPARFPSPFAAYPAERVEGLRVTLVGHATILVQAAGLNILVDPVWSERVSPTRFAGPRRVNPPGIAFDDLPPVDAVLVTHNHYDHLDVVTIGRLWERDMPRIVAPLGNDTIIRAYEDAAAVDTLDWGGGLDLGEGVSLHLEPANHWSARGVNDRRMALWGAYVLKTPRGTLYLAGDTGYGDGDIFRAVPERHGPVRLACLPIGAYEPRWFMQPQHMNPADAVMAFRDLGAQEAIGIHWGTFQLTDEGIEQPPADLAAALAEAGIAPERFAAFRPGQVWEG